MSKRYWRPASNGEYTVDGILKALLVKINLHNRVLDMWQALLNIRKVEEQIYYCILQPVSSLSLMCKASSRGGGKKGTPKV